MENELKIIMLRFLRAQRRHEKLLKIDAPEPILQQTQASINQYTAEAAAMNFDIDSWFQSSNGKVCYLMLCSEEDHREASIEQCDKCSHYAHIDDDWKCLIHEFEIPMQCKDKNENTTEINKRIMDMVARCSKCMNSKIVDYSLTCKLKLNMLDSNCKENTNVDTME